MHANNTVAPRQWAVPTVNPAVGGGAAAVGSGARDSMPHLVCAAFRDADPVFHFPNLPMHWYRAPYVAIYLLRLEPSDWHTSVTTAGGAARHRRGGHCIGIAGVGG